MKASKRCTTPNAVESYLIQRIGSRSGATLATSILKVHVAPLRRRVKYFLGGVAKNQPIEVGVVSQRVQVVIVLCTNTQVRLQIQCLLK